MKKTINFELFIQNMQNLHDHPFEELIQHHAFSFAPLTPHELASPCNLKRVENTGYDQNCNEPR